MKRIKLILIMLFACFCLSCEKEQEQEIEKSTRYDLISMIDFQDRECVDNFEYYYVEFFENGECVLEHKKIESETPSKSIGSFTKTNNQYIVNINGMTLNFVFLENDKLECQILVNKLIFKKGE